MHRERVYGKGNLDVLLYKHLFEMLKGGGGCKMLKGGQVPPTPP